MDFNAITAFITVLVVVMLVFIMSVAVGVIIIAMVVITMVVIMTVGSAIAMGLRDCVTMLFLVVLRFLRACCHCQDTGRNQQEFDLKISHCFPPLSLC